MKLHTAILRNSLFLLLSLLTLSAFSVVANAQEKPSGGKEKGTVQAKFPAAKAQQNAAVAAEPDADSDKEEKGVKEEKDSPDTIRKRDEWFYKQRSSANGHIPAGARLKALQHMHQRMEAEGKLIHRQDGTTAEVIPPGALVTNPWTSIGPTPTTGGTFSPVTGRITTIAVDPSDLTGSTALIGGAQGGIWRTTNAGTTWTPVGDQDKSLSMGSIAFAPSSAMTVYAGTGEQASIGFDIYYGAGVLKSTNGGQTWAETCTTPSATCPFIGPFSDSTPFGFFTFGGARISYISVNPTNPQMVLAAAQFGLAGALEGVYCTDNGGTSWSHVLSGEMSTFVGFANGTTAFAALGNPFGSSSGIPGNGIFKATSIGTTCPSITFSRLTAATLPVQSSIGRIDIGISPNFTADNTVYASIANSASSSDTNLGVFVSGDGGTTWTRTTAPDVCQQQCWYDNVVKVDPTSKNIAYLGGAAVTDAGGNPIWVERTTNGGTSWATIIPNQLGPGLPHVDNHAIALFKLGTGKVRMYLGNDGGIWRTDDAQANPVVWNNLNDSTLTLTQFYPAMSVHPSSQGIAFAGAQDNGSQIYDQAVNGATWTDNNTCGDGTGTAVDNVVPSTVYVTCNGINIAVSTVNGQAGSFFTAVNGIDPNDNSNFVPPLVTDPNTANTVYAGTTKVYQSVNTGNSWTALSGDLVNGGGGYSLIALAVAPGNSKVVYAGADTGQIFVSSNVTAGAASFSQVTGQASLPPRQVSSIAIDGADLTGKTAYAAFSGFALVGGQFNDPIGHLFKTTDGGQTWKDVSCTVADCTTPAASDLPNTPVNDVVVDPNVAGTLYAATDIGVYQGVCTTTGPTTCTWSTLSTGLPRVAVLSLKLHAASRTLRAATHGRGAWDIVLNNFTFTGPHISSISPVSASAGSGGFTLTVNGNGLTNGAVLWNGSVTNVTTQQVSDTKLTATIAASLTSGGGAPLITVKVGANTSNPLTFTVLGGAPTIASVTPVSAPVNSAATQITVTGTGFASNSIVLMNPDVGGTPIATTFVSATKLTAIVPATFMANFGSTNSVGVQNPPPGGGTTLTTQTVALPTFTVVAPAPSNDLFANAIAITSTAFTDTKDSSGATTSTNDPIPACSQSTQLPFTTGISNTIWYKFTPGTTATAELDTIGSSYDSVLSVWTGSAGSLSPVACNDDINPGIVVQSQITNLTLTAGTTYFIMVSSFGQADPNPIAFGGKSIFNFSFTGSAAAPTITTISPTNTNSGGPAFLLTVNGTNFVSGATLTFTGPGGVDPSIATTFVNSTQLTATIPATDIQLKGNATVVVNNPAGGGSSSAVNFTINFGTNPVPIISNIMPTTASTGGPQFTLTVTGTNFVQGAVVNFNGKQEVTTFVNLNQITATIPAADIATAGTVPVTVTNPTPGGGTSTPASQFQIQTTNPLPTVTSLIPTSTPVGGPGFTLIVNGTNFVSGQSVVNFNGQGKATTFVNSTQMKAAILAPDIATGGTVRVDVSTDPPGGGTSGELMFQITNPIPTVTSVAPTTMPAGSAAFTLTVNGTNFVNGSVLNFNGAAKATTFVSTTKLTASILAADIATAAIDPITVTNPIPGGGNSTQAVNFTVTPPPSFTLTSSTATVPTTPGGTMASGTSMITVHPSGGFAGAVVVTCASLPGVTCSPLTISSGSTTGTLTINAVDPSSSMTAMAAPATQTMWAAKQRSVGSKGWWTLSGGTGLAAMLLLFLPGKKRLRAALGLGLTCVLSFTLGCGGGGSGGGGGGPVATTTRLTLSATKVQANGMITVSATVTGGTPTGGVQFFVDGTMVGSTAPLTGGSTGNITVTAANAPAFLPIVGTHAVSAHYLGDTKTMASQSGILNVTVTGTTSVAVTGTSGSTTANGNVSLTIN